MALRTARLHFYRFLMLLVPETSLFGLKRSLLRWSGIKVEPGVKVCSSVTIYGPGTLSIGKNTWIGHECLIISSCSVKIGKNVDIAPRVFIGTGTHEIDGTGLRSAGTGISKPVEIGHGVWLGAGSMILPGTIIGEKAVVAAGAVVTKAVQPYTLVGGVPAKPIRKI